MPGKQPYLIVVVGPTAVGKTSFCVNLARHFGTEVINADSRQVYRELSVGTAKPTPQEQAGIPHHLTDFLSIKETYTAGMFEQDALSAIARAHQEKQLAILSGGTGLYVKSVCEGLDDIPASPETRAKLNSIYAEKGLAPLQEMLQAQDPIYYLEVDRTNPQRLIRALEAMAASGETYAHLRKAQRKERPFKTIKIGLARERTELYSRIDQRVDMMLAAGLKEEAKQLYSHRALNALQTVGYQEFFDLWDGNLPDEREAVRLIKRNSRRYAKRQLTWFRRDLDINWFHPDALDDVVGFIEKHIRP